MYYTFLTPNKWYIYSSIETSPTMYTVHNYHAKLVHLLMLIHPQTKFEIHPSGLQCLLENSNRHSTFFSSNYTHLADWCGTTVCCLLVTILCTLALKLTPADEHAPVSVTLSMMDAEMFLFSWVVTTSAPGDRLLDAAGKSLTGLRTWKNNSMVK